MYRGRLRKNSSWYIVLIAVSCFYFLICATSDTLASIENITIECSKHRCFIVSEPQITSEEDLGAYIDTATERLFSADSTLTLQAVITFRLPLTYQEIEGILGDVPRCIASIKYISAANEEIILRYPIISDELAEFEELDSSHAGYVAAYVTLPVPDLRTLASSLQVLCVDPGPINFLNDLENPTVIVTTDLYEKYTQFQGVGRILPPTQQADNYSLAENYPNPFNPVTEIRYTVPKGCHVKISVYNILGQKVITLADEDQLAGHHNTMWDGKDENGNEVASGIYFYQLRAGEYVQTRKMVLMK